LPRYDQTRTNRIQTLMPTVVDMIQNLEKFDVKKQTKDLFQTNSVHAIELNQAQMLKGLKRTGQGIGTYSTSPLGQQYAEFKSSLNPEAGKGNVDLKLTGAFYKAMKMKIAGENIDIDSTDKKSKALTGKYGEDVFGLTKNNWQIWLDEVFMPDFMLEMNKATGLTVK